jgi:hypothetical protein
MQIVTTLVQLELVSMVTAAAVQELLRLADLADLDFYKSAGWNNRFNFYWN